MVSLLLFYPIHKGSYLGDEKEDNPNPNPNPIYKGSYLGDEKEDPTFIGLGSGGLS